MNIQNGLTYLTQILHKDDSRKPISELLPDLVKWTIKNKGGTYYFHLLGLHQKGKKIDDFLTVDEYTKMHDVLDPVYYRPLLEDKIIFDRYIKSFNIPSPEMIGIIENGSIFWIKKNELDDLEGILQQPMHAYCKLVTSWGGKDIFKLDVENNQLKIDNKPSSIDTLREKLGEGKYILQDKIIQHKKLNELNSSCVNTLRVYTKKEAAHPKYINSFLRMGVGGSIVDNVSSENLAIGLTKNHFLAEKAFKRATPPIWVTHHPDSKIKFSEFEMPFHQEAIDLCCSAHQYFSDFLIIAWDVAIEENGPVMLEGNPAPCLSFLQALYGGLKDEFSNEAYLYQKSKLITRLNF